MVLFYARSFVSKKTLEIVICCNIFINVYPVLLSLSKILKCSEDSASQVRPLVYKISQSMLHEAQKNALLIFYQFPPRCAIVSAL